VETLPTIYGLIWVSPRLLIDTLSDTGIRVFKDAHSYTRLFELMVEDQNIDVQFNFEVTVNEFFHRFLMMKANQPPSYLEHPEEPRWYLSLVQSKWRHRRI